MEGPTEGACKAGNFPVSLEDSFRSTPISATLFVIPPCQIWSQKEYLAEPKHGSKKVKNIRQSSHT